MSWVDWLELALAIIGFYAILIAVERLYEQYFGDGDKKAAPKPRPYRVTIEDPDGWPYRNFHVSVNEAAHVVRDLERLKNE